jgi:hypothetical protein
MSEGDLAVSAEYWGPISGGKLIVFNGAFLKKNICKALVLCLVRQKKAWGAMWTYDFDCEEETSWYHYICDAKDYDVTTIKNKKGRYYIRRSLNACVVKQVDYHWLANNAYDLYINAAVRYKNFTPINEEAYRLNMLNHAKEDGRDALGVFVGDQLAAYANLGIVAQDVKVYASYFHPAFSNCYPMYALYYSIAKIYLRESHIIRIDNGCRPLSHDTNIGDFVERIGWRKAYCRLDMVLRFPISLIVLVGKKNSIFQYLLPAKFRMGIDSLIKAQGIVDATKKGTNI